MGSHVGLAACWCASHVPCTRTHAGLFSALKAADVPFLLVKHPTSNIIRVCSPERKQVVFESLIFKHSAIPGAIKAALKMAGVAPGRPSGKAGAKGVVGSVAAGTTAVSQRGSVESRRSAGLRASLAQHRRAKRQQLTQASTR